MRLTAPIAIALTALALGAAPALAVDLDACEDEVTVADAVEHREREAPPPRLILPCAVAEHVLTATGDLACADATLYVVTHAGTLLCEIDVPALVASSSPTIERAPAATLSASSAFSAAGLASLQISLLPPLVVDLPRGAPVTTSAPRDGFARPPAVPS